MCVCMYVCIFAFMYVFRHVSMYVHIKVLKEVVPWSRVLLQQLTVTKFVTKFPSFYGTRRLLTAITTVRHLSVSWVRSTRSKLRSCLLNTHCNISLSSKPVSSKWSLLSGFPTRNYIYTSPLPIYATWLADLVVLDLVTPTVIGWEYRLWNCSLCTLYTVYVCMVRLFPFAYTCSNREYLNSLWNVLRILASVALRKFCGRNRD
jgi:hypothetical protein